MQRKHIQVYGAYVICSQHWDNSGISSFLSEVEG